MRLPFLRPKPPAAGKTARTSRNAGGDDTAVVEAARTRARRRLVGALVLLIIGVLGFPLLFETQPRPLPLQTPIELARRDPPPPAPQPAPVQPAARPAPVPVLPVEVEAEPSPVATPGMAPAPAPPAPASAPALQPAPAMASASPARAATSDDGARARALLDGRPASAAAGRFIVQVGAFSDANALRDARAKVEKLGLKTYTQVIDGDAGKRTRVRVGPFATRDEADAAAAKLKRGGMAANILVL